MKQKEDLWTDQEADQVKEEDCRNSLTRRTEKSRRGEVTERMNLIEKAWQLNKLPKQI